MTIRLLHALAATLAASLVAITAMAADAPAPAATPAPAAPAATPAPAASAAAAAATNNNLSVNEPVGDWTVRCFNVKSVAPCDIIQLASNTDTKQRLLLVSIAYVPSRDAFATQIIVPLGVTLSRGLTLAAGDHPLSGVKFSRCERDGCYVEMQLPAETVTALKGAGDSTNITLTPYAKADTVTLPVSLKGFGDALAKMQGYARQKATAE
jgi:invasion protein IalB